MQSCKRRHQSDFEQVDFSNSDEEISKNSDTPPGKKLSVVRTVKPLQALGFKTLI